MNDFDTLQKMPNNVGELGKIIVDTSFECLPKVQKIAKTGHTGHNSKGWSSLQEGDEGSYEPNCENKFGYFPSFINATPHPLG